MIVVGGTALITLLGLFGVWSYMAQLAVDPVDRPSLAMALFAFDEGRLDDARAIVGKMQHEARPEMFGGALFVLGAVKANEADTARSDERQRAMHLVAARYLQKARLLGVPPARETQAKYLHARSLILGQQGQLGIPLLNEIVTDGGMPGADIDVLLVHANLHAPDPNLAAALSHSERALATDQLPESDRAPMRLVRTRLSLDWVGSRRLARRSRRAAQPTPESGNCLPDDWTSMRRKNSPQTLRSVRRCWSRGASCWSPPSRATPWEVR